MADAEIQPSEQAAAAPPADQKASKSKKKAKKEKPDDAVKLGCGGFFRRKKKTAKQGEENGDGESKAPVEKPQKNKSVKGVVKIEQGPQTEMWTNIVSNSLVGTGVFKRAAACSLESGGVLACSPAGFTPTVEQVATLRDNFANRAVFSAAGFGVADTVYQLQDGVSTPEMLCGSDSGQTEGILVTRSNTAMILASYTEKQDQALEMLGDLRKHFISQGL